MTVSQSPEINSSIDLGVGIRSAYFIRRLGSLGLFLVLLLSGFLWRILEA